MNDRWVIVGGTFDPVHEGHLQLARSAVELLGARVGVLAVGAEHPHRSSVILPRQARIELVRIAVRDEAKLVEAGEVGGFGRSIVDVAQALQAPGRELHFVFGSDSAARLVRWNGGVDLAPLGTIWAVDRSNHPLGIPTSVCRLPIESLPVSSTEIRERCDRGASVTGLVPSSIHERVVDAYGNREPHRFAEAG